MKKMLSLFVAASVVFAGYGQTQEKQQQKKPPKKAETKVLICNSSSAYAYHSYQCHGLNRCKQEISRVTISEAKNQGYRPCKICY